MIWFTTGIETLGGIPLRGGTSLKMNNMSCISGPGRRNRESPGRDAVNTGKDAPLQKWLRTTRPYNVVSSEHDVQREHRAGLKCKKVEVV